MSDGKSTAAQTIGSMSREEMEIVAARLLQEWVRGKRLDFHNGLEVMHLAVRLEAVAQEARHATA